MSLTPALWYSKCEVAELIQEAEALAAEVALRFLVLAFQGLHVRVHEWRFQKCFLAEQAQVVDMAAVASVAPPQGNSRST